MRHPPLLDPDTLRRLCRARDFLAAHTREPVPLTAAARATFRDAAGNWFSLTQPKPH